MKAGDLPAVFGIMLPPIAGEKTVPTPVGEKCYSCDEAFVVGDSGEYHWYVDAAKDVGRARPVHAECALRSVIGGLNHLRGLCTCCGGDQPPDPEGMSPRQAALAAAEFYNRNGLRKQTNEGVAMGQLAVMGSEGDTKIIWDADDVEEVAAAKAQFDALTKKGFLAFSVEKKGDKGEQIRTFDPAAERIILTRPLKGG